MPPMVLNLACFLVLQALTSLSPSPDPPKASIRVFITSEVLQDGWVAPGAQERADSARDLAGSIRYRNGLLAVTDDRNRADLVVQVTGGERGDAEASVGQVTRYGLVYAKVLRGRTVWATVYVGETSFKFMGTTDRRYWSHAAEDLAQDLQRWAKDNYDRILERRQRPPELPPSSGRY